MKKRKIKLFASVASLAMVAAVMGVGVWAATQQSVTINSTVGFTATGVQGTIDLKVTGGEGTVVKSAMKDSVDMVATGATIATFALEDEQGKATTFETIAIQLNDTNGDGWFDSTDGNITYTFTFNNTSATGVKMFYMIAVGTAENWTATANPAVVTEVTTEDQTATVTFTYTGEAVSAMTTTNLPQIKIGVGSDAAKATAGSAIAQG